MKTTMKEIDVIVYFTSNGDIKPLKFRYKDDCSEENIVIPVNKILTTDTNVYGGNLMHVFHCETLRNGINKSYEIRYELKSNTWYLCMMHNDGTKMAHFCPCW